MTQYPPPPPPYGYGYDPYQQQQQPDPLAPARRASVMMFVLGGILSLCGVCLGAVAFVVPMAQLIRDSGATLPQAPPGMSIEELMRIGYITLGVGTLVAGVVLIVLGLFVRRGGMGSIVTSMILLTLMLLLALLSLLLSLPQMASQGAAAIGMSVCMLAVPIALMIGALIMLAQAARASSGVAAMRQQQQFQMWQYQQQQQAYQQGGYSMPAPPTGPPAQPPQPGDDVPR